MQQTTNGTRPRPFDGEKVIRLKNVRSLDLFCEKPSYDKVLRWARHGVYKGRNDDGRLIVVKLESRREGRLYVTSVEAVARFLEATQ